MSGENEVYRSQQINYCLSAIAITLVIFGILYSIVQGGAVVLFAASVSLTGIPLWLMLKNNDRLRSGVLPLWGIHAGINLGAFVIVFIVVGDDIYGVIHFGMNYGIWFVLLHIGLLVFATIEAVQRRLLFESFALAALYLCPLLLAIGILFFDT